MRSPTWLPSAVERGKDGMQRFTASFAGSRSCARGLRGLCGLFRSHLLLGRRLFIPTFPLPGRAAYGARPLTTWLYSNGLALSHSFAGIRKDA